MTAIASANKEVSKEACFRGSALILTVVLTSLLAIVGVMFLMISRIDRMATSAVSEKKQLDLAVDTLVGKISTQLVWDVPGANIVDSMIFPLGPIFPQGVAVFPDGLKHPEYHDYPGPEDRWLAASEPNNFRMWPQISDVTGYITRKGWTTRNIPILVIPDHSPIVIDPLVGSLADADGDGIGDSKWFPIEGITSSKGEPIYAAVRITDNGGKINVNTGFEFYFDPFDPCLPDISLIDGTSLLQINLMALANRPGVLPTPADANPLLWARANYDVGIAYDRAMYEDNVIWRYGELQMPYTPFDISDELELRNRFLLNQRDIDARIERLGWAGSFINSRTLEVPVDMGGSGMDEVEWFARANESVDRLALPAANRYDYRHLATTYSMDRIINPIGSSFNAGRMVNVNTTNVFSPYDTSLMGAIKNGILDANPTMPVFTAEALAAQLAANIKDFRDDDSDVTPVLSGGKWYFGYERPCIYISQVAGINATDSSGATYSCYAVELHKPYFEDNPPKDVPGPLDSGWQLKIEGVPDVVPIDWSGTGRYHVILLQRDPNDPNGLRPFVNLDPNDPDELLYEAAVSGYVRNLTPYPQDANFISLEGKTISLQRKGGLSYLTADSYPVPSGWLAAGTARSYRRDISQHKCIRRLWAPNYTETVTLGVANGYVDVTDVNIVQAHPYLDPGIYSERFKNVGEISMVFDVNGYNVPIGSIEDDLRLDLQGDPNYARIFNYLTVVDPANHGHPATETRVKGRININTAPSFVLEQLPWIAPAVVGVGPAIVDMVVAYRDKLAMPGGPDFSGPLGYRGFRSIGELTQVWVSGYPGFFGMDYYGTDGLDQDGFPELTPLKILKTRDGAVDDFEERDLIFHRISNLITVRSDVFTAYILVRIGAAGPQRRVLAILDRSNVQPNNPDTKVKVRALHKVADPW